MKLTIRELASQFPTIDERPLQAMTSENSDTTAEERAKQLIQLLNVEQIGDATFLGMRQPGGMGRVFGGQVIAQGLVSAMRTVEEETRVVHSLHAYFMRGGSEDLPITYSVDRDFDGGSFSTRRVTALQEDRPILTMTASFHRIEQGFAHQDAMPNVPGPETLMTEAERIEQETDPQTAAILTHFQRVRPIEVRWVEPRSFANPVASEPKSHAWFRFRGDAGEDQNLHRAILSYMSDMALLGTAALPHAINWHTAGFQSASLDHAVWLHDDVRVDEWLLYATDSPWAGRARGFNRGSFYAQDGRLVASVAQEGLMRYRPPATAGA